MTLCTVYDGCSTKKEETLLQNYLPTYINPISFFCNIYDCKYKTNLIHSTTQYL